MRANQARIVRQGSVPRIWLLTDERIALPALLRAAQRLPRGSGIIVRHYRSSATERRALFDALARVARRRHLLISLAAPLAEARRWGAAGAHGAPRQGEHLRHQHPAMLRTIPVHDCAELRAAERAGADAVLLSPLFATRSHPGARTLGLTRFATLARLAHVPVIALGGVHPRHATMIRQLGAWGYAAIDGLARR